MKCKMLRLVGAAQFRQSYHCIGISRQAGKVPQHSSGSTPRQAGHCGRPPSAYDKEAPAPE